MVELAIDEERAARAVVDRIADEFKGRVAAETVQSWFYAAYRQFLATATTTRYVPVLAGRVTRERLHSVVQTNS